MLTPVVLLPSLWILRHLTQGLLEKINAAFMTLIIFVFIGAGTYWTYAESPQEYTKFLTERGFETNARVLNIRHETSILNGGSYDEVEIEFQDQEGTPLKANYLSISRRFFPPVQEPITLPAVGDTLRIAYFPTVESGLVVLTDAKKSLYGAKLECIDAQLSLRKSELRYRHEDVPTWSDAQALRNSINAILPLDCIDLKERDRLRDLKEKLK